MNDGCSFTPPNIIIALVEPQIPSNTGNITKEMVQKKTIIPFLRQDVVASVEPTVIHPPEEYQHPESA